MIFENILKTVLPFYDSTDKQNRNQGHCGKICDYKLLTPVGKILPFQIMLEKAESWGAYQWFIRCAADDSTYFDLTGGVGYLTFKTDLVDNDYCTYNGVSIPGLYLECGTYYMELVLTNGVTEISFYSEVFTVINDLEDVAFSQMDFPLKTLWRWYDNADKRAENLHHCLKICNYYLKAGQDALLPFMFRKPTGTNTINTWVLETTDGECAVSLDTALLETVTFDGYDYIYYKAEDVISPSIPCGIYYSTITIDGINYYSEPIEVIGNIETLDTNYILQENGFIVLAEDSSKLIQE